MRKGLRILSMVNERLLHSSPPMTVIVTKRYFLRMYFLIKKQDRFDTHRSYDTNSDVIAPSSSLIPPIL